MGSDGGMGRKPSDYFAVPLCKNCHQHDQHLIGEPAFWDRYRELKGHTVWDVIAELIRTSPRRREIEEHREGGCSLRSGPPATDES